MKTDRELLEKAAKAAGIRVDWRDQVGCYCYSSSPYHYAWSPLKDDGDALWLAVKLNLTIKIMADHVKVGWRGIGEKWIGEDAPIQHELRAATRRAIVRAAAALADSRGGK